MPLETFDNAVHRIRKYMLDAGREVDRGEWQSLTDKPQNRVYEVYHVNLAVPVNNDPERWAEVVKPNLPWAEDHFQERVSGEPMNPGEQYKNWPWYKEGWEAQDENGQFSHTYMERFWPERANRTFNVQSSNQGIRFYYGDLDDAVYLLNERPYTRQAYLPIWFPEDLQAAVGRHRVPCTLGYHFMRRPHPDLDSLDVFYPMRSCDWFRYFRDDVYMAGRLMQWVVNQVPGTEPGTLVMQISNLHIFAEEVSRLRDEHQAEIGRRLGGAF